MRIARMCSVFGIHMTSATANSTRHISRTRSSDQQSDTGRVVLRRSRIDEVGAMYGSDEVNSQDKFSRLIAEGEFDAAIAEIRAELEQDPDNGDLFELLGMTLHVCGQMDQAMSAFESATALVPLAPNAQIALAECYVARGLFKSATAIFDHLLLMMTHTHPNLLPEIVKGYSRMGKNDRALEACRLSVARNPDCDKALFGLAFYKAKCAHSLHSVIAVLEKAIDLAPGALEYRMVAARLCLQAKHFAAARRFLQSVSTTIIEECKCQNCVRRLGKMASNLELYELAGFCQATLSTKRIK